MEESCEKTQLTTTDRMRTLVNRFMVKCSQSLDLLKFCGKVSHKGKMHLEIHFIWYCAQSSVR